MSVNIDEFRLRLFPSTSPKHGDKHVLLLPL